MTKYNNLPLYQATINMNDDESGMFCISLVDYPATECNFLAFGESKKLLTYKVEDEEKRKVFGLVMAANLPIYRLDKSGYEYFIVYSKETISKMAEKYLKQGYQNNVDTMHNFNLEEGITLTQMFIKDAEKGVSPEGFEQYEDGSLFAEFHVENDEIWEKVKNGEYKGFSLAGYFNVEEINNKSNNNIKMKIEKLKSMLRKMLAQFGEISTDKGVMMWEGEDEITEGVAVHSIDDEGNEVALEDGEYVTEDKRIIVVEGGNVKEIRNIFEENNEEKEEEKKEEEEEILAAAVEKPLSIRLIEKFEAETYNEKEKKMYDAIYEMGISYFYLIEAADDYCIAEVYDENYNMKYYKYAVSWNEEGNVVLGEAVEVVHTFVEKENEETTEEEIVVEEQFNDEKDDKITSLETENEELKNKIAELEKEPAALSAKDEFGKTDSKPVSKDVERLLKRGYKF